MTSEIGLSCIIRHPEHNKIKIDMVESGEAFGGVFEFCVQETLKDLVSQNGKHIVLKPKQEAAMRVYSVDRLSLQSIYQILVGHYMVTTVICISLRRYVLKSLSTQSIDFRLRAKV